MQGYLRHLFVALDTGRAIVVLSDVLTAACEQTMERTINNVDIAEPGQGRF